MTLESEVIMKLFVDCEKAYPLKDTMEGFLQVIPIIGGTFEGKISGKVISGGADWNNQKADQISFVSAKYVLCTDDGEYIGIENTGMIQWNSDAKIKTSPKFWADKNGKYAWLNSGVYVASLDSGEKENQVKICIYRLL